MGPSQIRRFLSRWLRKAAWKVNFKAVKVHAGGPSAPLHPPSLPPPPCAIRLIGICCAESAVFRAQASSNGSPRLRHGRKMSRRHRKGKRAHPRPLRGTLSVTGFGSAPVLTSSGAGTQMYSSPVALLRPEFSAKSEGRVFLFKTTGNK